MRSPPPARAKNRSPAQRFCQRLAAKKRESGRGDNTRPRRRAQQPWHFRGPWRNAGALLHLLTWESSAAGYGFVTRLHKFAHFAQLLQRGVRARLVAKWPNVLRVCVSRGNGGRPEARQIRSRRAAWRGALARRSRDGGSRRGMTPHTPKVTPSLSKVIRAGLHPLPQPTESTFLAAARAGALCSQRFALMPSKRLLIAVFATPAPKIVPGPPPHVALGPLSYFFFLALAGGLWRLTKITARAGQTSSTLGRGGRRSFEKCLSSPAF